MDSDDFVKSILAFLPSPKRDLVEVQKAMFKVPTYLLIVFFYFLTNWKMDLRELQKMFHVFAWPCLFIFFHLSSPKSDLDEVGKWMIRLDPRPYKTFFSLLGAYKWKLFDFEKGNIEGVGRPCKLILCLWPIGYATWASSRKWIYKETTDLLKSFFGSWQSQVTSLKRSQKL
jgi:hypothetical protein